ncbi:hypothetical protein [Frisingicoccus sp.]|uniref:hypothetical protein n=1 Tax=Frisingicoccus sp. TaxID=1918627 RepID=UPI003AB6924A
MSSDFFWKKRTIEKYLASGQIETVLADGKNYEGARPLYYEWVKLLYDQCKKCGIPFSFYGTGNVFIKDRQRISYLQSIPAYASLTFRTTAPICKWRNYPQIIQPASPHCYVTREPDRQSFHHA